MSTHKNIDRICCVATVVALLITAAFMNGEALGLESRGYLQGYEERLFDNTVVHTIDIIMDDWDEFIDTCENEEYSVCSVVIDGEAYKNVGIRAKGNTSLRNVSQMNSDRYSFKIEFDRYDSTKSYYGLDKLSLNNLIQDNTFMKDYLVYQMMNRFGAAAPLCSFAYITVNGRDWGLYLAAEGIEEAFLQRNYGSDYGELYKPDSMDLGGGRGNGQDFNMDRIAVAESENGTAPGGGGGSFGEERPQRPNGDHFAHAENEFGGEMPQLPGGSAEKNAGDTREGKGSSDVKLQYIDDDPESYSNIFGNAKTNVTEADKARLIESLKTLSSGENISEAVDIEQIIRYFVVHNFAVNGDSYTGSMIHNYYLYEKDGILSMLPWDYNLAFGTFHGSSGSDAVNDPIDTPVSGGNMADRPMIGWIFSNQEYTEMYHSCFEEFIAVCFDSGWFEELVDSTTALISPYVKKDPTKFCTYGEFELGADTLKEFCILRTQSVKGQLDGSIPSTEEGQKADGSALVDSSSVSISDMGTMSMGGGANDHGGGTGRERLNNAEKENGRGTLPDAAAPEEALAKASDGKNGEASVKFGEAAPEITENVSAMAQAQENGEDRMLLAAASSVILALGLIFAALFKRRKG